ncbi:MAG: DNA topoisomerase [Clostridiales bacterium]|nr:MAG: DNA topoisomerase [Clostridiales bacterium]
MVYSTIMRRFAAVFCAEECIAQKTEIKINVGNLEDFTLKGTIISQKGWTKFDDYTKKDKILPNLEKGRPICG